MKLFAQITKVDVEKREVYGRAVDETPDRASEVFDYDTSKGYFESWSSDVAKSTDGKSLGNVRSMHSNVAAGKVISMDFDDAHKSIDVGVKVVDDNEWDKVLEGVHTGFSIGGKYVKKWQDGDLTRYTASPTEISLVDRPCIPSATFFDVVKADGVVEQVSFKSQPEPAKAEPVAKVENPITGAIDELANMLNKGEVSPLRLIELATADKAKVEPKYADVVNKRFKLDTENEIKAAWYAIHVEKVAAGYESEALALVKSKIKEAWGSIIKDSQPAEKAEKPKNQALAKVSDGLAKGLYTICSLAELLSALSNIQASAQYEADYEGDGSTIPADLLDAVKQIGAILIGMTMEEVNEAIASAQKNTPAVTPDPLQMAAPTGELAKTIIAGLQKAAMPEWESVIEEVLAKAGARNSADDQQNLDTAHAHIQAASALLVAAGATPNKGDTAPSPNQMPDDSGNGGTNTPVLTTVKSEGTGELLKGALSAPAIEIESIKKAHAEEMKVVLERLAKLEAQPMPMPSGGKLRAVGKDENIGEGDHVIKSTPGQHNPEAAHQLIKAAFFGKANPIN